jgi:hypothetical protein
MLLGVILLDLVAVRFAPGQGDGDRVGHDLWGNRIRALALVRSLARRLTRRPPLYTSRSV